MAKRDILLLWENKLQKQAWSATTDYYHTEAAVREQQRLSKIYNRCMTNNKWIILRKIFLVLTGAYFLYRYVRRFPSRNYN